MPYEIKWLNQEQGIYEISISDPFTDQEANAFFPSFFNFMDGINQPVVGLFDITRWSDHGMKGITDPRFLHMGTYRAKIRTVVMVTNNILAVTAARAGARVLGYNDLFHFVRTRQDALDYINQQFASPARI